MRQSAPKSALKCAGESKYPPGSARVRQSDPVCVTKRQSALEKERGRETGRERQREPKLAEGDSESQGKSGRVRETKRAPESDSGKEGGIDRVGRDIKKYV